MIDRRKLLLGTAAIAGAAVAGAGVAKAAETDIANAIVDYVVTPLPQGMFVSRCEVFIQRLDPATGLPEAPLVGLGEVDRFESPEFRYLRRPVVTEEMSYRITHPQPIDDDDDDV